VIGLNLDLWYPKYENGGEFESTSTSYGAGVGYFHDSASVFVPFALVTGSYVVREDKNDGIKTDDDEGFSVQPMLGIAVFVTDSVGIALAGFYQYTRITDEDSSPEYDVVSRDYGVALGIAIALSP
jgi:hypothetical protein